MITVNPTILRRVLIGMAIAIAILILALLLWGSISYIRRMQHNRLEEKFVPFTPKDRGADKTSLDDKPSSRVTANPVPKAPNCFKVQGFTENIFADCAFSTEDMLIVHFLDPDNPMKGTEKRLAVYQGEEVAISEALRNGWGISKSVFGLKPGAALTTWGITQCKARVLYVGGVSEKEMKSTDPNLALALVSSVYQNMFAAVRAVQDNHHGDCTKTVCYVPTMEYGDPDVEPIDRYTLFLEAFLRELGLSYDISNLCDVEAVSNKLNIGHMSLVCPRGLELSLTTMLAAQSRDRSPQSGQSSSSSQAATSSSSSLYPFRDLRDPGPSSVGQSASVNMERLFQPPQQPMSAFPQHGGDIAAYYGLLQYWGQSTYQQPSPSAPSWDVATSGPDNGSGGRRV